MNFARRRRSRKKQKPDGEKFPAFAHICNAVTHGPRLARRILTTRSLFLAGGRKNGNKMDVIPILERLCLRA
jgi:hypothetical protein